MIEITPRFGLPPHHPRGEGDLEATEFKTLFGGLTQSQFFYADPNGTGGTGTPAVGHGQGSSGPLGGAPATGPKQVVRTNNKDGGETVKLKDFAPPGWEEAGGDPAACYRLACDGASQTAPAGESVTGGGGVILYEDKSQRIKTDKTASDVALEQIKRHIDAGRAVVAGVSEPASSSVVNAKRQPVTDHFVAVYGYETDVNGKIVGLYAKDNAVGGTAEIHFVVGADGSITKPKQTKAASDYLKMEYQLSEVRFHKGFEYTGNLRPTNDAGENMVW